MLCDTVQMDSETEVTKSATPKKAKDKKKSSKKKQKEPLVQPQIVQFKAKVEVVREHQDKTPPVVGYFPSGFDPLNVDGTTRFQVYRHRNMRKRLQLAVSPAASPVDYVGTNYSGEAATGHPSRYALGVFDKETGTLKVVPIAANKVEVLKKKIIDTEKFSFL